MAPIKFVTTNEGKFREVQTFLTRYGIVVERIDAEYPEVQARTLEEVVRFGAEVLAGEGLTTMTISLRAHGDSSGQRTSFGYGARHDLIAAVEFLEREFPGRPIKAGDCFSAAFVVGYFDAIDDMHAVNDRYKGHTALTADASGWQLLK